LLDDARKYQNSSDLTNVSDLIGFKSGVRHQAFLTDDQQRILLSIRETKPRSQRPVCPGKELKPSTCQPGWWVFACRGLTITTARPSAAKELLWAEIRKRGGDAQASTVVEVSGGQLFVRLFETARAFLALQHETTTRTRCLHHQRLLMSLQDESVYCAYDGA